ncbi:NADPH-dependent aldehyde reductase-like protein, chloroplastic [Phragmites australis]|uniref:NADPH-dependent aldehyde reductase-like protein, chloroplastic n=1 Tax=Phragmites australis TaxID=29695 RepID=UPI002D7980AD|nr:NADPH-dependent aldehyde reductase-like protein, chloroplastic [Phragmites australis]
MAASNAQLPLDGRVALVTGGSRGIGREVSSHLAALGARVVVNYASNSARADELVAELTSRGHSAVAVRADVSDPDAVRALFDRTVEAFGSPPHIVVSCAGLLNAKYPALADTTVEDFDAMFAVNVRGTFLACREAARRIPPNSGGRIVTFSSSIMGTLLPGYAAYTATNGAVEAMTRILAKEVAAKGVTANVVAPGPVRTELFLAGKDEAFLRSVEERSMGRIAETTEVAAVVAFLVSDAAAWVNGQVIRVNGGFA